MQSDARTTEDRRAEAREYGVFFADSHSYDYMQHLKVPGTTIPMRLVPVSGAEEVGNAPSVAATSVATRRARKEAPATCDEAGV